MPRFSYLRICGKYIGKFFPVHLLSCSPKVKYERIHFPIDVKLLCLMCVGLIEVALESLSDYFLYVFLKGFGFGDEGCDLLTLYNPNQGLHMVISVGPNMTVVYT